ncbi:MAG: hypothetical protein K2K84_06380 [Muribaculaceae bacterium]|nr:hypothetical protein [Muribaculaceae bacterium]
MSSKRDLKKRIRYACGDTAAEILTAYEIDNLNPEKVGEIVGKIAKLQTSSLANVSFSFDKTTRDFENKKAYNKARREYSKEAYNNLLSQFMSGLTEIVKDMNAVLTDDIKAANVKSLAKK